MRVGIGFDAHRFDMDPRPLVLGGVTVDQTRGLAATSDGDVVAHAITDAVLGAAGLGDMGDHFPSNDPRWELANSLEMLRAAVSAVATLGYRPHSVDVTVVAESVRVSPFRTEMREALASSLGLSIDNVSVKATSTDGMGSIGADEGMAALAVAVLGD